MSTYFSKIIKTEDRNREFNFRQLANGTDVRYSIDVPDEKGNRITFSMYRNAEGKWKTSAQILPIWIHNAENALGIAIEEFRNSEMNIGKTR